MTIGEISGIITGLVSLVGVVLLWKKASPEIRDLDGKVIKTYQEIIDTSATREQDLMTEVQRLRKDIEVIKESMKMREIEDAKWRDWARRLAHQVQSLGAVPVLFDPEASGKVPG
jgi:hypothetical protein